MGKVFDGIDADMAAWIARQPMFFVATAPLAGDGRVNLSPRGHDCFSVLDQHRVAWVDYTGSGVETIAHLRENGRVCLMWCSFGKRPRIVRLHGAGRVALPGEELFERVVAEHPDHPGTRAVIVVDVARVSESCGFGVPVMEVVGERDALARSAQTKGPAGMAAYRAKHNAASIDGLPGYPRQAATTR
jgi:Pyridoxamine 5'-phosphate oxidase